MTNILPISASAVQRDLDQSIGPALHTGETVASIPGIKYNPPEFMLPWLIWEYGLEQLLPYLSDPRLAIQEGVRWQRIRGTPGSLTMALGWLGFSSAAIEPEVPGEHFYQYQVDTGRIVSGTQLENVQAVARFSAPLRSRLSRLYHGYDVRRLTLDESDYGALLSDYSGIRKDSVVLSFGRHHTCGTTGDEITVAMGNVSHRSAYVADVYWPALDNEPLGGILTQSARLNEWAHEATPEGSPWLGYWDNRSWGESSYPLIATRSSALHTRKHDKDFAFDQPNTRLSITFTYSKDANLENPLLGLGTTSTRNLQLDANQQPGLALADSIRFNVQAIGVLPHGLTWLGHWDTRVWQTADYANVGVQNNALVTHYYDSETTWHNGTIGAALESVHQFYGAAATATLNVSQTSAHSIKLSETTAIDNRAAVSVRTDHRISDVTGLSQFWQGQWDTRQWSQTNNAMVGLHHHSLFIRQHPLNLTIDEPVTGMGYFYAYSGAVTLPATGVDSQLTKSYMVKQLPVGTLTNEAATSIRLSERAINISQQGEFWLGYWDTRIWTDSHKLTIGLAHKPNQ